MITISKGKLKAQMLQVFRELEQNGEEAIITDNNRPVLVIRPIGKKRSMEEVFADFRGKVIFHEDPNAPTIADWEGV